MPEEARQLAIVQQPLLLAVDARQNRAVGLVPLLELEVLGEDWRRLPRILSGRVAAGGLDEVLVVRQQQLRVQRAEADRDAALVAVALGGERTTRRRRRDRGRSSARCHGGGSLAVPGTPMLGRQRAQMGVLVAPVLVPAVGEHGLGATEHGEYQGLSSDLSCCAVERPETTAEDGSKDETIARQSDSWSQTRAPRYEASSSWRHSSVRRDTEVGTPWQTERISYATDLRGACLRVHAGRSRPCVRVGSLL